MKTNKITLIASIIIIAVLTYLGFIVAELNQYNEITTNDINISNAVQQAITFNTIKVLLCIFVIGYICIEIKGYYDHQRDLKNVKSSIKDFADFIKVMKPRQGINTSKSNPIHEDIFGDLRKEVKFDKKPFPERTDYPLGEMGNKLYKEAITEYEKS